MGVLDWIRGDMSGEQLDRELCGATTLRGQVVSYQLPDMSTGSTGGTNGAAVARNRRFVCNWPHHPDRPHLHGESGNGLVTWVDEDPLTGEQLSYVPKLKDDWVVWVLRGDQ